MGNRILSFSVLCKTGANENSPMKFACLAARLGVSETGGEQGNWPCSWLIERLAKKTYKGH